MKRLLKYLKNYKLECIVAPSFKMLEALFELFVPLVMTKIIDEGIKNLDKSVVIKNGCILFLLGLIGLVCSLIAQYFAARAAIGFANGLRKELYSKILSFSHENTDNIGASSLITRMTNDINTTQNGVNMVLRLFLRSPFIVFGAMIMAFTINVKVAIVFVLVIPLLFAIVSYITFSTIPRYKNIQKGLDKLTLHIRENLSGSRVIRAFGADEAEQKEFTEDNDKFYRMNLVTSRISALLNPATLILVNIALLIVIYQGGNLVFDGTLTNGQVIALINYMSQILVELVKLTNLFVTINKATASASRIADTLDIEVSLKDLGTKDAMEASNDTILEFENVSFCYPGAGAESLNNISFTMKRGETIGIIGATGSGKSSLSHLIMRFYDTTSGKVSYMGKDVKEYTLASLRKAISLVPQKAQLFSASVRDNLTLGNLGIDDEQLWEALRLSEAKEIIEKKGQGLDYMITEAGTNLSGGQRQRLTIARALASQQSSLLILDDSSSALDYATDASLRANLKTLKDRLSVIIIAQRVISVKDADKILVLDDGNVAGFDTHENLLNNCDVYKEIVSSQSGKEEM